MVCPVYYLGCMVVNINVLLLNEALLNVTTFRYCCLGFLLAWNPLYYLFSDIDAVTATFQVLVNTYFLNFRIALLWFCLLIVLRALVHLKYSNF